jgi:hypothetical protein
MLLSSMSLFIDEVNLFPIYVMFLDGSISVSLDTSLCIFKMNINQSIGQNLLTDFHWWMILNSYQIKQGNNVIKN